MGWAEQRGNGFRSLFFLLSFATVAWGAPSLSLNELVQSVLPGALQRIMPGQTTHAQAEKLLGSPMRGSTPARQFFQLAIKGADVSDLTLGYEKDRVRYFYFKLPFERPGTRLGFSAVKPLLGRVELERMKKKFAEDSAKPNGGRTFEVEAPGSGLLLRFQHSTDARLDSVVRWKPGEKMP